MYIHSSLKSHINRAHAQELAEDRVRLLKLSLSILLGSSVQRTSSGIFPPSLADACNLKHPRTLSLLSLSHCHSSVSAQATDSKPDTVAVHIQYRTVI